MFIISCPFLQYLRIVARISLAFLKYFVFLSVYSTFFSCLFSFDYVVLFFLVCRVLYSTVMYYVVLYCFIHVGVHIILLTWLQHCWFQLRYFVPIWIRRIKFLQIKYPVIALVTYSSHYTFLERITKWNKFKVYVSHVKKNSYNLVKYC
jgi:hypothetical protein